MPTLAEAAALLGVAASTLRHQVQKGRIKATLIGKTYVVTDREVERYRREQMGKSGRPRKLPVATGDFQRGGRVTLSDGRTGYVAGYPGADELLVQVDGSGAAERPTVKATRTR